MDNEIEKKIYDEYKDILELTDDDIRKMSFAESCIYLEKLNEIEEKLKSKN